MFIYIPFSLFIPPNKSLSQDCGVPKNKGGVFRGDTLPYKDPLPTKGLSFEEHVSTFSKFQELLARRIDG